MASVGQRIRAIRQLRGFSQMKLASQAGIHLVTLQNYELGKLHPRGEKLQKIADALDVDVAFLYPLKAETPNSTPTMRLYAIIFDLVDEFGDIDLDSKGGQIQISIKNDSKRNCEINQKLIRLKLKHTEMSPEEFKRYLLASPIYVKNGETTNRWGEPVDLSDDSSS